MKGLVYEQIGIMLIDIHKMDLKIMIREIMGGTDLYSHGYVVVLYKAGLIKLNYKKKEKKE